jgi:RNA polymerase sigma-54 factor
MDPVNQQAAMALSVKLQTRQSQQLTMTPQLVQSIKLLQMSSFDLLKHIEEEIEKNPLLELAEGEIRRERDIEVGEPVEPSRDVSMDLDTSRSALEEKLGTSFENEFESDRSGGEAEAPKGPTREYANGPDFSLGSTDISSLEEYVAGEKSLRDHLWEQLALTRTDPAIRLMAMEIIDGLDTDGYFRGDLPTMADQKGLAVAIAENALQLVQGLEPLGIAARNLSECLAIQLKEKNRLDPAMENLLAHLDLLARKDFQSLLRHCQVNHEDLMDMVGEIRALDPRPARAFDHSPVQNVIPDVIVSEKADGSFAVELNSDAMPKVLVNQTYQAIVERKDNKPETRAFITDCLQDANWLVRSLEQRAQTILKVMVEIVRQQDGFFAMGISHMKPMSLKQVADAISMHESTVSRVTSNKYVLTNRGTFELKFFFTAAINAMNGEESHSAEAVRQKIRQLIGAEQLENILSDDSIVESLKSDGIDIARRTVAKYRESMHISSSVQRRREKKAMVTRYGSAPLASSN